MSPHPEMVVRIRSSNHFRVDVAAEAQFDANVLLFDHSFDFVFDMDNVSEPVGSPGQ